MTIYSLDVLLFLFGTSLLFHVLECKSRKSRNTWSNRQIWPWNTKRSKAKANRVLPKERTGHSKHPLPTTQGKTLHMDITRWSTQKSDWWYSLQPKMEKLYTVSKNKTRSWLWLRSWTPYCQGEVKWSCSVVSNTLYPMDYSLLGFSVHGIFQARILEWVAISFSMGSSWPKDWTQVSCIAGRCFTL